MFKWGKGEHEEWYRKIKAFNRKIDKAKKEGYAGELPLKINYRERLNNILNEKEYSRTEFNNQKKAIDIFLEKDSLEIVKSKRGAIAPKWELDTINKVILKDINKNNLEFKKQAEKIVGKKEKTKLNDNETRIRKLKFDNKSKNDFEMFIETFNDFNKDITTKNNEIKAGYLKAIKNEIGGEENINAKALNAIIEKLPVEVVSANAILNERTEFNFIYSKDEYDKRFKILHNEWTKIYKKYQREENKKQKATKKKRK
jgi:hypothetical protein